MTPTGRRHLARLRRQPAHVVSAYLVLLVLALLASACGNEERRAIRVAPTSTADPGVRVIVDNCPGPATLVLSVRDETLWQIDAPDPATVEVIGTIEDTEPEPGLREFLVGEAPEGWTQTQALTTTLDNGIRYTVSTEPDGQSIDFSLPDLAPGLLFDGQGRVQFNRDLINEACSQPADVGAFARDLGVLVGLWITSAALVMVALILLLFVITRRFSRIRSIQKRAHRGRTTEVG